VLLWVDRSGLLVERAGGCSDAALLVQGAARAGATVVSGQVPATLPVGPGGSIRTVVHARAVQGRV
jgi:hypothetical protein